VWDWLRKFVRNVRLSLMDEKEFAKLCREARRANTEHFPGPPPSSITHLFSTLDARYYDLEGYRS